MIYLFVSEVRSQDILFRFQLTEQVIQDELSLVLSIQRARVAKSIFRATTYQTQSDPS